LTRNNQISPSSGNGQPEPRASDEELYNSLEELPKLGITKTGATVDGSEIPRPTNRLDGAIQPCK